MEVSGLRSFLRRSARLLGWASSRVLDGRYPKLTSESLYEHAENEKILSGPLRMQPVLGEFKVERECRFTMSLPEHEEFRVTFFNCGDVGKSSQEALHSSL